MDLQSIVQTDQSIMMMLNGSDSIFLDSLMATLTNGWTWLPLYVGLLMLVVKNNDMRQTVLTVIAAMMCILLADGVAEGIVKPLVGRPRPLNDPVFSAMVHSVERVASSDYSFFSAHAANTFSLTIFFTMMVRSRAFSVTMVAWSLLNCYTRIYLGMHYPFDILVGLAWGAVVGLLVYTVYRLLYRSMSPKPNFISSQYTRSGYSLADVDAVIALLVLTVAIAAIVALISVL